MNACTLFHLWETSLLLDIQPWIQFCRAIVCSPCNPSWSSLESQRPSGLGEGRRGESCSQNGQHEVHAAGRESSAGKGGKSREVQQNQERSQAPNPQADGVIGKEGLFLQNCAQTHGYGACQTSLSFLSFLRDYRICRNWQGI